MVATTLFFRLSIEENNIVRPLVSIFKVGVVSPKGATRGFKGGLSKLEGI